MTLAMPGIAALAALFLWWFSTGSILLAVRLADRGGRPWPAVLTAAALPVLAWGVFALWVSAPRGDVGAAYLSFLGALAVWGWVELAFLTGQITGPVTRPCPPGLPEWERFLRAWGTVAHHELALLAALVAVVALGWHGETTVGPWTFAVLYFARVSAKLNLYLGVPRINIEFMPAALAHLPSHFRIRSFNWLFPLSISALTFACGCWLERLWQADTPAEQAGFALLGAITALAVIEHWLMVVPLPDAKLWRWMLPAPNQTTRKTPEGHHEF